MLAYNITTVYNRTNPLFIKYKYVSFRKLNFLFSKQNHCSLTQWPALAETVLLCSAQQMRSSTTKTNNTHLDQNAPNKPRNPTETSPALPQVREVSNVVWLSHGPSKPFQPKKAVIFFGVNPLPFLPLRKLLSMCQYSSEVNVTVPIPSLSSPFSLVSAD